MLKKFDKLIHAESESIKLLMIKIYVSFQKLKGVYSS